MKGKINIYEENFDYNTVNAIVFEEKYSDAKHSDIVESWMWFFDSIENAKSYIEDVTAHLTDSEKAKRTISLETEREHINSHINEQRELEGVE